MNKQESDILNKLYHNPNANQRELAELSQHSLGVVNRSIHELMEEGYISSEGQLTDKAYQRLKETKPRNAIILAAGYGMRMVPINMERPKGLLEVHNEPLIERQIKQLQEVGITKIYVVVGFMKEMYEYLIDEYGVELIVNPDYAAKNNLYSLRLVGEQLSNTYIVPCDVWCDKNPFQENELYSWYMVSDLIDEESTVRVNRKMELVTVADTEPGNAMIGIAYLTDADAKILRKRMIELTSDNKNEHEFWEKALYQNERMMISARVAHFMDAVEINTYEQLRELDRNSNQLEVEAIRVIMQALQAKREDITDITVLKKGMTNRSFLFSCFGKKYIMRIPGEGTEQLINRAEEAAVYQTIGGKEICDDIAYINSENGYKITEYLENARVCDAFCQEDLEKCMQKLRNFHQMKLTVDHEFDIFHQILFYENLWNGEKSIYKDYEQTKAHVMELKDYIKLQEKEKVLTHIDVNPDNFLFFIDKNGKEEIRLIDWEYSAMQDPHVDIAMFCIYTMYNREQVDNLIDIYFEQKCSKKTRIKIYAYIAACGLLWSNWCEYKRQLGIEFGEYSLRQYRYAKEYYKIVQQERGKSE